MPALPVGPLSIAFRLGSVPVVIQPSFWIGVLILGLGSPEYLGLWVPVVLIAVLVHELGHALAFRIFGAGAGIQLVAFGGVTHGDRALSRWRSLVVSLAGPFAGFVLGALLFVASQNVVLHATWARFLVYQLIFVSFYWGALNLLPILPLDGGHVAEQLLGPRYAHHLPAFSAVAAALAAGYFALTGSSIGAVLFALLAVQNFQMWSARREQAAPAPVAPRASAQERQAWVDEGWAALRRGDERAALLLGTRARDAAQDDRLAAHALDLLAWAWLAAGQPEQALSHLQRVPVASRRAFSWALALDAAGRPADALPHALQALSSEPTDAVAALATRLLLRTGDVQGASSLVSGRKWGHAGIAASMRAEVALAEGRFADAAEGFRAAFLGGGRPDDALGAARAWVRAGAIDWARAWLDEAGRAGFDAAAALADDRELAPLVKTARS